MSSQSRLRVSISRVLIAAGLALALLLPAELASAAGPAWLVPPGLVCPRTCKAAAMVGPMVGDGGSVVPPDGDRSEGYDPGTSWPTLAFGCPGQSYEWDGNDDDHTYGDVQFQSTIAISGVSYLTSAGNGARWYVPHHAVFYVSLDGVNYTQVGELSVSMPDASGWSGWVPVQTTWPAVQARYFRWIMDDNDGTMSGFPTAKQMRLLADPSVWHAC